MKFLNWITSLFKERSYKECVELYVASKRPTSTAEVEYWIRDYDQKRSVERWAL